MQTKIWPLLVLALAAITFSSAHAVPRPDDEPLHRGKHVVDTPLTDEEHYKEGEHNPDYDHEAFLGEQEARTFDQLSPDESQEKLGLLVDKIDKDSDGKVTQEEMREWIKHVQTRYISKDTERQWKEHDLEDGFLTWPSYKKRTYGFLDDPEYKDEYDQYDSMVKRDQRRWEKADQDKDGKLSEKEFGDFLHPEETKHMKDVVVHETMEDIDKDKDGFISLEEYIGDMWPNEGKEAEPDWVKSEKEAFSENRDKDKDGKLSFDEVRDWVMPDEYDHVDAETKHLFNQADDNKDGELSREEILEHHDTFVGSQATDYGEALTEHDEF